MNSTFNKAEHTLGFTVMGTRVSPVAIGSGAEYWEAFTLDLAPGARSPLHTLLADKVFVVTAGTVAVSVGDRTLEVTTGGHVQIPAGTVHGYHNSSTSLASMVALVTSPTAAPAQVEFLRGMATLTGDGPPDPVALAQHTARHGVRLLPPTTA